MNADMTDADDVDSGIVTLDKVSLLQESVDKMALSMFNALRPLPATTGDDTKNHVAKDAVWPSFLAFLDGIGDIMNNIVNVVVLFYRL